jgi:GTP-binding protein EngB required for normal cell division
VTGVVRRATLRADVLLSRITALQTFLDAVDSRVPDERLAAADAIVERAGERLALSRDHTIVALAGATGSGKSSLFNAIAGATLSPVGVRRPTTGAAHACTWGPDPAKGMLDWLAIPPERRFTRDDGPQWNGLVLVDLPDFDSVEQAHREEVDRLLELVDLVVWVLDPQKYADRMVHEQYLAQFKQHDEITLVVLNQADLLSGDDLPRVVEDLRKVLSVDGLAGLPVLTTSAVGPPGVEALRMVLQRAVAARFAMLERLLADVRVVTADLSPLVAVDAPARTIDKHTVLRLSNALADAAGVPSVVEATEQGYRHRAASALGWPLVRWARRLRPDPLRRLHLPSGDTGEPAAATSLPRATDAERASVALAARAVAEYAASGRDWRLPDPWPDALLAAARSRLDDVPDALDVAITRTDLGLTANRIWWRVVGGLQWLGSVVALVGLVWLAVRFAMFAFGLPELTTPEVGVLPLPTVLFFGGLLFGLLLAVVVRPFVVYGARRAKRSADRKLRNAVANTADRMVVTPVREVLVAYSNARKAMAVARRP